MQAEYYDTCASSALDNTTGNSGGELRTDDVDIVAIADGYAITDMQSGEYVEYSLTVQTSGLFDISFAVQPHAANTAGLALSVDGAVLGTVDIAANDSTAFGEYTLNGVYISDGAQVIRVTMAGEGAAIGLDSIAFNYTDNTVYTPENAVLGMGIGINLGNTLDAFPNEGDWAPAAQEYYFKA